jgi:hypothetical protein
MLGSRLRGSGETQHIYLPHQLKPQKVVIQRRAKQAAPPQPQARHVALDFVGLAGVSGVSGVFGVFGTGSRVQNTSG